MKLEIQRAKKQHIWGDGSISYQERLMLTLKNKRASYFYSKLSSFRQSRGFAIWDKQTLVNHRQVWRRGEILAFIGEWRKLGEAFSLSSHWLGCCWVRRSSSSCWVCKVSFFLLGNRRYASYHERYLCKRSPFRASQLHFK